MRVTGTITGSVADALGEQRDALSADLRAGMARATLGTQADLRTRTRAAGLGNGLEKAWRANTYPPGNSKTLRPAGLIYSKATVLHRAFAEGATITAKRSKYLAIPTKEAEALGYARTKTARVGGSVPGGQMRRASQVQALVKRLGPENVRVAPARGGKRVVIYTPPAGRGKGKVVRGRKGASNLGFQRGKGVVMFVLVKQTRLRAKLDLAAAQKQAEATLGAEIAGAVGS